MTAGVDREPMLDHLIINLDPGAETSLQAQIVIPMAVSLAFGVLFATVITLVLIPCQYVALEDAKRLMRKWFSRPEPGTEVSDKQAAQHN